MRFFNPGETKWKLVNTLPKEELIASIEALELKANRQSKASSQRGKRKSDNLPDKLNTIKRKLIAAIGDLYYLLIHRNPETAEKFYPHIAKTVKHEAFHQQPITGGNDNIKGHHIKLLAAHNRLANLMDAIAEFDMQLQESIRYHYLDLGSFENYIVAHLEIIEETFRDLQTSWPDKYQNIVSEGYKPTGFKLSNDEECAVRNLHPKTPKKSPSHVTKLKDTGSIERIKRHCAARILFPEDKPDSTEIPKIDVAEEPGILNLENMRL